MAQTFDEGDRILPVRKPDPKESHATPLVGRETGAPLEVRQFRQDGLGTFGSIEVFFHSG